MRKFPVIFLVISLAGCATLGSRSSDDPALMLRQAAELYSSESDPVHAEQLIRDAMTIAVTRKDLAGLAESYRQYGLFFRSTAVGRFEAHYRDDGFLDRDAAFDARYENSIRYLRAAEVLFAKLRRFDALSEVYAGMAKTFLLMNNMPEACEAFDLSISNHSEHQKALAAASETPVKDPDPENEYLKAMKQQAGCQ
ncbi:MAG: hypothetical protein OEW15_05515 [Nitrospirota bacterium]|nr:hypothetical protein [Nitrospirota bacterium]